MACWPVRAQVVSTRRHGEPVWDWWLASSIAIL
jgi:hypothetical protein